ncbi:FliM/FliN family flagellar motor switch protein [Patulibacter minatonensis]|uniref:FliM/FliN family flagellar motor switch protein n=1 Tax=Patulibacter minatonensis TaxID=298163 RepID=UPI000478F716|nr:FliM/FliN family flagellar motor switch protein [Patulibacter minatonensis]
MTQAMSQEAISALVEAARDGSAVEAPALPSRRARRLRRMDFSRPTKFSNDQERRIRRAMETFGRSASTRMSAELRTQVEFEVIDLDQLGWAAAHAALPGDAIGVTLEAGGGGGRRFLLTAEQPFVLTAVELLLGGATETAASARRLGDIDWALSALLFEHLVSQLGPVWDDLCGLPLSIERLDPTSETGHLSPVSEPTLVVTMEVRLLRRSSAFVLLVPHSAVAAVADALAGATDRDRAREDDPDADAVVRAVEVVARAEVARVRVTLDRVLALRPGDLVRLEAPTSAGVELCVEDTAVFRCRPGRLDARRAVQVEGLLEDGT